MTPPAVACCLYEPDGTLLSRGTALLRVTPHLYEALITDVDQPGRLVYRCLLGPVRDVVLSLHDGRRLPAQVERVFFDPHLGRTCVLHVGSPRIPTLAMPPAERRHVTPEHVAAIHAIMRVFVEDDRAAGISARSRLHCDGCQSPQPMPGFLYYAPHFLCTGCATAYEVARAQGLAQSANQFVRDRVLGAAASATHHP